MNALRTFSVNTLKHTPGEYLAVCAACGKRVFVPAAAGLPPVLIHKDGCPREVWPIHDAIRYNDGSPAIVDNWPSGPSMAEFNVYGGHGDSGNPSPLARVGLGVSAARALELALSELRVVDPSTQGWLAAAINDLNGIGASVLVEDADGHWTRIVRAG